MEIPFTSFKNKNLTKYPSVFGHDVTNKAHISQNMKPVRDIVTLTLLITEIIDRIK